MRSNYLQIFVLFVVSAIGYQAGLAQDNPAWLDYHLENIGKMRAQVETYTSGKTSLHETAAKPYLLFAVSKRERENWFKELSRSGISVQAAHRMKLNAALEALTASAANKLPMYKPAPQNFAVRNPAGEKLILQKLKERLGSNVMLTIYKSGFQSNWQIYKDSIGLPQYRFMRGYIYAKNPVDDHPYCHLYYISANQDYAGGGTYASSVARFEDDLVVGCP